MKVVGIPWLSAHRRHHLWRIASSHRCRYSSNPQQRKRKQYIWMRYDKLRNIRSVCFKDKKSTVLPHLGHIDKVRILISELRPSEVPFRSLLSSEDSLQKFSMYEYSQGAQKDCLLKSVHGFSTPSVTTEQIATDLQNYVWKTCALPPKVLLIFCARVALESAVINVDGLTGGDLSLRGCLLRCFNAAVVNMMPISSCW